MLGERLFTRAQQGHADELEPLVVCDGRVDDEQAVAGLVLVDGDVVALERGVGRRVGEVLEVLQQAGLARAHEAREVGDARARRGPVVEHALLERQGGARADPSGVLRGAHGHDGLVAGGDVEDVPLEPAKAHDRMTRGKSKRMSESDCKACLHFSRAWADAKTVSQSRYRSPLAASWVSAYLHKREGVCEYITR